MVISQSVPERPKTYTHEQRLDGGWRRLVCASYALAPREGLVGVWDAIRACVTDSAPPRVYVPLQMVVYVRVPEDAEIQMYAMQLTFGENQCE